MKTNGGKVIVITGGSSGIGRALMFQFGDENTVVSLSRNGKDERNIECDVTSMQSVTDAFKIIEQRYGKVDILINNAGYGVSGVTELLSEANVEGIMDVNFTGVFRVTKCALPLMKKGGKIVNVSSACALFALPYRSTYCASKAAVNMLSYSLREELRPLGISVTAICPGDVKTEFTKNRVKNLDGNERYGDVAVRADLVVSSREDKRMDVTRVAKRIKKITLSKKCKPFYIVGAKYKILYALKKFLPLSWILRATGKMFSPKSE